MTATCTPCTYSQAQEEDFCVTLSLDMNPSSPSSGTNTAATSCESEQQMDGSPVCKCGKETSGCLIHPNTREEWIASMRDSLAKISAGLGIKLGSAKEREADFTGKCSELLTSFDRDTCIWRTSQQSLLTNSLEPFSETWPRAGMMRGGRVYQHRQPVPRTTVIGGGALQNVPTPTVNGNYNRKGASQNSGDGLATWARMWPTPTARNFECKDLERLEERRQRMKIKHGNGNGFGMTLGNAVRMWPTPCSSASKGSSPAALTRKNGRDRSSDRLDHAVMASDGGQLNPDWVEWLMGFPIGHTASKPSATPKSRSKPRLRG